MYVAQKQSLYINVKEYTEGAIKKGQTRESDNTKKNTTRLGHHYTQTLTS